MDTPADTLIDALGGTTAVARLTKCPLSTVHSWRRLGIPESRFDHVRLAALEAGCSVNFDDHRDAIKGGVGVSGDDHVAANSGVSEHRSSGKTKDDFRAVRA